MSAICLPPFCWRLLSAASVPTRCPEVTFGAVHAAGLTSSFTREPLRMWSRRSSQNTPSATFGEYRARLPSPRYFRKLTRSPGASCQVAFKRLPVNNSGTDISHASFGLNPPWRQAMSFLTYSADLILGAIAGLVVLGVGGIDTSDPVKLIGTCVEAGVGGSGFLTNLGSKAQAGTDQATATAQLDQQTNRLQQAHNAAGDARQQVQDGL